MNESPSEIHTCKSLIKLLLRHACTHDAGRGGSARDQAPSRVNILRAAPFLMRESLHTVNPLLALDCLHIGQGSTLSIIFGKEIDVQRIAMEASKSDELPAVPSLGNIPNKCFHLRISHARGVPVERWAQIVCKHCAGALCENLLRKPECLRLHRLGRLHPDGVAPGRERDGTGGAKLCAPRDPVVTLDRPCNIPVKEDVEAQRLCLFPHFWQAHLVEGFLCRFDLCITAALCLHGSTNRVWIRPPARALLPVSVIASVGSRCEGLRARNGGALDEGVVNRVCIRINHRGRLSICARNNDKGRVQDVSLQAASDKAL